LLTDFFVHEALAETIADTLARRVELSKLKEDARYTIIIPCSSMNGSTRSLSRSAAVIGVLVL
jgi:hypothetical protein